MWRFNLIVAFKSSLELVFICFYVWFISLKLWIEFWRLSILLFTHESVFKMSALRPHTCLFRTLIRLKSHKSYSRTFCAKFKREDTVFFHLPKQYFVPLLNVPCSCKYSKQTGSLTDDILKTRAVQDIPKEQNEQKQKDESKTEGADKKKESKWTGKNSWRLGLISLGGMLVMFGGSFIYLWGMIHWLCIVLLIYLMGMVYQFLFISLFHETGAK